jgi:4-hydroxybenzoate polyprenyltransferase
VSVTYFINNTVFFLSPVALFVILVYSYTKRFTSLSHFVLGVGLSLAPIGAYLCVVPQFDLSMFLMSLLVLFWVSGFDIIYALQDEEFDRQHNLKSIPALLGAKKSLLLARFLHLLVFFIIIAIGIINDFGFWYWSGSAVFSFFLIYQHYVVGDGDLSRINLAFFTANGIASIAFMMFFLAELYL